MVRDSLSSTWSFTSIDLFISVDSKWPAVTCMLLLSARFTFSCAYQALVHSINFITYTPGSNIDGTVLSGLHASHWAIHMHLITRPYTFSWPNVIILPSFAAHNNQKVLPGVPSYNNDQFLTLRSVAFSKTQVLADALIHFPNLCLCHRYLSLDFCLWCVILQGGSSPIVPGWMVILRHSI